LSLASITTARYSPLVHKKHMKVYDMINGKDTLVLSLSAIEILPRTDSETSTLCTQQSTWQIPSATQQRQTLLLAHSSLFSPVLSTLETALEIGYVTNFPGLTAKTLRKHPPKSIAMTKGHQDQTRKNQRLTKTPVAVSQACWQVYFDTSRPYSSGTIWPRGMEVYRVTKYIE
jgi:hypothetical protein